MQAKLKICSGGCGKLKIIWKNHEGKKYCAYCWYLGNPNPKPQKPKSVTRIAGFSAKKIVELRTYRILRDEYFKEHPVCEFPGCCSTDVTLHHKKGRIGKLLTDIQYFCSLCQEHHLRVETHPKEAREMKLSFKRLDKD